MEENKVPKPVNPPSFKKPFNDNKLLMEVAGTLKVLEDKFVNLRKKAQLTDQALIDTQQRLSKEKKLLYEELKDTKVELREILEELKLVKSELSGVVKAKDLDVLEKYLSFWNPSDFITRDEAQRLIDEVKKRNKFK